MLNAGSMIFLILSFLINEIILPIVTSIDIILKIAREYVIIGIAYLRLIPKFFAILKEKIIEGFIANASLIVFCIFLLLYIFYKSKQQKHTPQKEKPKNDETQRNDQQISRNDSNECSNVPSSRLIHILAFIKGTIVEKIFLNTNFF